MNKNVSDPEIIFETSVTGNFERCQFTDFNQAFVLMLNFLHSLTKMNCLAYEQFKNDLAPE